MRKLRVFNLSISARMTLVFALLISCVLFAGVLIIKQSITNVINQSIKTELNLRWEDAAEYIRGNSSLSPEEYIRFIDGNAVVVDIKNGKVLAKKGVVPNIGSSVYSSLTKTPKMLKRKEDDKFALLGAKISSKDNGQALVIAIDVRSKDLVEDKLVKDIIIVSSVVFLVTSIIAYFSSRGSLAPVESIRKQAIVLAEDERLELLEVPDTNDEIHRLAHTINNLLSINHQIIKREQRFVADAGHELRTPLAAISAEVELALEDKNMSEELKMVFTQIDLSTKKLEVLTNQLLQLGKVKGSKINIKKQLVNDIIHDASKTWREANLDVNEDLDISVEGSEAALVDELLLGLLIINLIDNSHKYGKFPVLINLSSVNDSFVKIVFTDQGNGFSDEFKSRALDPFTKSDDSRNSKGVGLGLAICSDIIKAHKGEIIIAEPTKSSVTIILPK